MKKIALLWAVFAVSTGLAQDQPSLVGTWKLDIAQSNFGSEPALESATLIVLKDSPQMFSWRVRAVDDKGKPHSVTWSGPEDGSMHPVMAGGKPSGSQQSAKREQDGTRVRHGVDADGSAFESHDSLSPDGNTLTSEITSKSKDGQENTVKMVSHRVVGSVSAKAAS